MTSKVALIPSVLVALLVSGCSVTPGSAQNASTARLDIGEAATETSVQLPLPSTVGESGTFQWAIACSGAGLNSGYDLGEYEGTEEYARAEAEKLVERSLLDSYSCSVGNTQGYSFRVSKE